MAATTLLPVGEESNRGPAPGLIVPIASFGPEDYEVLAPFHVVVQGTDGDYSAHFFDANIGASGETQQEAVDNLKDVILMCFESLVDEPETRLGPSLRRQKSVLERCIARRPRPCP